MSRVEVSQASRADFAQCELVAKAIVDGRILFSFERDADRERCYRQLDTERQRNLHANCAEVCAKSVDLEEAVRHSLKAGQHDRAAELAVSAAASLSARHANGEAAALLEATDGEVKAAIVHKLKGVAPHVARTLLFTHDGSVRLALAAPESGA